MSFLAGSALATAEGVGQLDATTFTVSRPEIRIQFATPTLTAANPSVDVTLPQPVQSLDRALVRVNSDSGHNGRGATTTGFLPRDSNVTARWIDEETIRVARDASSTGPDMVVTLEVWEYKGEPGGPNEFIVRSRQDLSITSGNASVMSAVPTFSSVNDLVPFISGSFDNATLAMDSAQITAQRQATGAFQLLRGGTTGNVDGHLQIVEFTGSNWTVDYVSDIPTSNTRVVSHVAGGDICFVHTYRATGAANGQVPDTGWRISAVNVLTFTRTLTSQAPWGRLDHYVLANPDVAWNTNTGTLGSGSTSSAHNTGLTVDFDQQGEDPNDTILNVLSVTAKHTGPRFFGFDIWAMHRISVTPIIAFGKLGAFRVRGNSGTTLTLSSWGMQMPLFDSDSEASASAGVGRATGTGLLSALPAFLCGEVECEPLLDGTLESEALLDAGGIEAEAKFDGTLESETVLGADGVGAEPLLDGEVEVEDCC